MWLGAKSQLGQDGVIPQMNHCIQIHAVVNHALTLPHMVKIQIQIHTGNTCLRCLRRREIKIFPASCWKVHATGAYKYQATGCTSQSELSHKDTHTLHHTQSQIRRERSRSQALRPLTHFNTHTCSQTHTGLALFWHAALRWAVWGV